MKEQPQEHTEFVEIRKKISLDREKGVRPTKEQIDKLRELDDYLATHTDYWKRYYRKTER